MLSVQHLDRRSRFNLDGVGPGRALRPDAASQVDRSPAYAGAPRWSLKEPVFRKMCSNMRLGDKLKP